MGKTDTAMNQMHPCWKTSLATTPVVKFALRCQIQDSFTNGESITSSQFSMLTRSRYATHSKTSGHCNMESIHRSSSVAEANWIAPSIRSRPQNRQAPQKTKMAAQHRLKLT